MTIDPKRTAILIIDFEKDFRLERDGQVWDLMSGIFNEDQNVPNLVKLIRQAKRSGLHTFYSSHYDPDLVAQFREHDLDTIIMIGISPGLCIAPYIHPAQENGFGVILIEDAIVEPGPEATQAVYNSYGTMANQVISAEDMIVRLIESKAASQNKYSVGKTTEL